MERTKSINIKDYYSIVLHRKYTILLIFVSIMVPLVFYVKTQPDTYLAKSQLVIEDLKNAGEYMPSVLQPTRSFNFYQGIFRSRSFLQAILDTIGIPAFRDFTKDTTSDVMRAFISGSISISTTEYESFVDLTARAKSAKMAYDLANAATNVFRRMCRQVVATETENTVHETENQLNLIREKLENAEHEFRKFSEMMGNSGMGATAELKLLQDKFYELKSEEANKDALYEADKRLLRMLEKKIEPPNVDPKNAEMYYKTQQELKTKEKEKQRLESLGLSLSINSQLNQDIERLERDILRFGSQAKEQSVDPKILNQWQKMRKVVVEDEMELEIINNKINVYESKIDQYKKKHPDELSQTLELARLERTRKVYEDTYNVLLEKVEVAKIRRAAETGGLAVIDQVYYPDAPLAKKEAAYYIAGIVVSILLSLGLVFIRELLDTTIKSTEDLEQGYHIPVIGTVPHIDIAKKKELQIKRKSSSSSTKEVTTIYPKELIDFYSDESVIAESYRSLRTNLFFASPDKPVRTLILTSSGPHEGKSLTASNLCLACAQMGKRVLLVDSDLRRPVVHHLFQLSRENGLTDLFIGKDPDSVIKKTDIENLNIITAGRFTPNPSELLASKKIEKIIEMFKGLYDLIVFDTPPVMAVTDASLLSTKVDGVLMIVKSYSTDKGALERSITTLQNINSHVIGFVLNDINLSHRYASYGYYKYYYHYYRSQKD